MDYLFELVWKNAIATTVLALAAALVTRWCRRPALAHGMWLLVLLKLVTPPLLHVPLPWLAVPPTSISRAEVPVRLFAGDRNLVLENPLAEDPSERNLGAGNLFADDQIGSAGDSGQRDAPIINFEPAADTKVPAQAAHALTLTWREWVLCGWALGSAGWLVLVLVRCRDFRKLAAHSLAPEAEDQRRLQELAGRIGLRRLPCFRLLPARTSPMTWAFGGRPGLLVPADFWQALAPEQRDALLVHELAHLRRGDHWVRYFELLLLVLYWWHPIYWFACRKVHEAEEQCCDAWVTWALPDGANGYADLLVDTVAYLGRPTPPALPPLASGFGHVHDLRTRLQLILRGQTPRRLSLAGWLLLVAAGCALLPFVPTLVNKPAPAATTGIDPAGEALKEEIGGQPVIAATGAMNAENPEAARPRGTRVESGSKPAVMERLDRMEKRLDDLMNEAQKLYDEVRAERNNLKRSGTKSR